jgi:serine/threonine-protein kinase
MGSVWVARNLDLDALIALKLAHFDALDHEVADRLKREARFVAQLDHRAIVRVFDCGITAAGDPFIAMELLEGTSLASSLELDGPMSAAEAVRLLLPIIDGLSAAHHAGIVHRDIKPGNIFLARATRKIQPKVLDFGIAKLERWNPSPRITLQGMVIGSPLYMAPEQARGLADVDHRADIWAICAVLYEAITGSPPFRGEDYNSVLRAIVEDEIMPLSANHDPEGDLWPILRRGLSKPQAGRFQSMRELGVALATFLLEHGFIDDICGDRLATSWFRQDGLESRLPPRRVEVASAPESSTEPELPRFRRSGRSVILSFLAAAVVLVALAMVVWRMNAGSAGAIPDSSMKSTAQPQAAETTPDTPAGAVPEGSSAPLVGAVVSPSVARPAPTSERARPRLKRVPSENPYDRASGSKRPRPQRAYGDDADGELKVPY